jgi:hypothetical protein
MTQIIKAVEGGTSRENCRRDRKVQAIGQPSAARNGKTGTKTSGQLTRAPAAGVINEHTHVFVDSFEKPGILQT